MYPYGVKAFADLFSHSSMFGFRLGCRTRVRFRVRVRVHWRPGIPKTRFVLRSTSEPGEIQYMREPSILNLSIREVFSKMAALDVREAQPTIASSTIKVTSSEWSISKNKSQFYLTRTKLPGSERRLNRSLLAFAFLENLHNSSISQNWLRPFNKRRPGVPGGFEDVWKEALRAHWGRLDL